MPKPLAGKVVAITGGSRGIGFAIAKACAQLGADVAIGAVDEATLREAADELGLRFFAQMDVADPRSFRGFLSRVENDLGPLDVLVNNAGIMPIGPLLDEDDSITKRVMEIDALGLMIGTKAALEIMVPRRHGHIINMCSTMGQVALPGMASYNASKAAAIVFSDAARLEHRHTGVKISTVLPGAVNTQLVAGLDGTIAIHLPGFAKAIPIIRPVEPEDVATAVVETVCQNRSRARVYVPPLAGWLLRAQQVLPRHVAETLNLRTGGNNPTHVDQEKRGDYNRRMRADRSTAQTDHHT